MPSDFYNEYIYKFGDPQELDSWISLSAKFTAFENLLLVGYLDKHPDTPIEEVTKDSLINDDIVSATENWLYRNFRHALRAYCDFHNSTGVTIASQGVSTIIKELSPMIAVYLGITIGPAVGFAFWALKFGLQKWCEKYAMQYYDGVGEYKGTFQGSPIAGIFKVEHQPRIAEAIKNRKKYRLPIHELKIHAAAITSAQFIPDLSLELQLECLKK